MKQISIIIVCTILLVGCNRKKADVPIEDTLGYIATDNVDSLFSTPWMATYLDYLKTDSLPCDLESYRRWGLAYIDDDEIPELVLTGNCEACGKAILTQHNGVVTQWYSWRNGVEYAPRNGLIRNNDGSMGHYYDRYIRLEKGVFAEYLIHEEYLEGAPRSFTILNSDTVDIEVYEREERNFESLPHMDMNQIKTYPIDILMEHFQKKTFFAESEPRKF